MGRSRLFGHSLFQLTPEIRAMLIVLTGATGFLGRHLLDAPVCGRPHRSIARTDLHRGSIMKPKIVTYTKEELKNKKG